MRLEAAAPLSHTALSHGAGDRDTHSSWVMSSSPSSSCGSWYRTMGRLHSDCICKEQPPHHSRDVPTPSGVPPSHYHHPKTPSVTPNQETCSQQCQEPKENTPQPQNQSPSRSTVCQVRAAVLEHRNMGPPRPPWGWSQENLVLRIPVPLTVGITSSGGAGRGLRLLPPATRRGDAGRVSHGSLRWRPARRWAGKRTPRRVTVPPAPVPAGSGLRISIRQNQVSPEGPLVGGYTTGDDPLFQSAP